MHKRSLLRLESIEKCIEGQQQFSQYDLLLGRKIAFTFDLFSDNTSNFNRLLYQFGSKCSAAQLECSTKCPFRQPTTLHCCFCVISPSSQPICFQTERKKKPSLSTHVASNTFQITHLYNLSKQKVLCIIVQPASTILCALNEKSLFVFAQDKQFLHQDDDVSASHDRKTNQFSDIYQKFIVIL